MNLFQLRTKVVAALTSVGFEPSDLAELYEAGTLMDKNERLFNYMTAQFYDYLGKSNS